MVRKKAVNKRVELEGRGEVVSITEFVRRRTAEGKTNVQIARELNMSEDSLKETLAREAKK